MKNYYIYAKFPSKPLIKEPERNVSWVYKKNVYYLKCKPKNDWLLKTTGSPL
jgi:hypothetical protein